MSSTTEVKVTSRPVAPNASAPKGATVKVVVPVDTCAAPKPMRKDAARNREALIASARVVFAQRGMEASLDDVARHAGLGVGTAYRHFANKYELLSALMDQIVDGVMCTAEASLDIDDPWVALQTFLERVLEAQVNDHGLREVMLGFHDAAKFDEAHARIGNVLTELLDRAHGAGVVRADAEASDVAVIITMLCAAADLTAEHGSEQWRRYLALCLEGLKPADPPLPERALTTAEMRTAIMAHKQALTRPSC